MSANMRYFNLMISKIKFCRIRVGIGPRSKSNIIPVKFQIVEKGFNAKIYIHTFNKNRLEEQMQTFKKLLKGSVIDTVYIKERHGPKTSRAAIRLKMIIIDDTKSILLVAEHLFNQNLPS